MTAPTAVQIDISEYDNFLRAKQPSFKEVGFDCDPAEVNPLCKPHQVAIICYCVRRGLAGIFIAFGLGKTIIQLEVLRLVLKKLEEQRQSGWKPCPCEGPAHEPGCKGAERSRGLIVLPLGVTQEFYEDAEKLGTSVKFIRSEAEAFGADMYLTNYETVRERKIDCGVFDVVSLDEAACLRSFGSKTFSEFLFEGPLSKVPFRYVATATPSPNEHLELLAYSHFLDVMDIGHAKTRFFKRNSERADDLTLHEHKKDEFWRWVSTWAVFVQKPSDLGFSDEGYELPPLDVRWHEVPSTHEEAGVTGRGQHRLLANSAIGVVDASREKRRSLSARIRKLLELREEDPAAHRILWHDLEDERRAIEGAVPGVVSVYGSQPDELKERAILGFKHGEIQELAAKPVMLGSGANFQAHCAWAVFLGIGFKFNDFHQAMHRLQRFGQTKPVRIDLIYTENEREVRATLERKWQQHDELVANMTAIIREYGLADGALQALTRSFGVERRQDEGVNWRLVNNDSVIETAAMAADSVDLILTSIPFSTQYEYSPSYNDFGHTDDAEHFFRQMDFLTPQLLRVLKPGRNLVVHVKDRVEPGAMTGLGFQTVSPFHADCIYHYRRHGFAFLGMKTIVTDVVRENNQTYRLGWTEQCKDGSRMGVGMPEYLLIFRKPPTDSSNGYADEPVVKSKDEYTRARWQVDAHGFMRVAGDRLLKPSEISKLRYPQIFKLYRQHSLNQVYDFEEHVALGEALDAAKMLPRDFMLLPPASWHPDVWTDVTRMKTLNGQQWTRGKELHLCPMQFDIADRVIAQMSEPGELVFDPFSGLGTVPLRALRLGRRGLGVELSPTYHDDAVHWLRRQELQQLTPSLFSLIEEEAEPEEEEAL
jgi:DNA modification methylase